MKTSKLMYEEEKSGTQRREPRMGGNSHLYRMLRMYDKSAFLLVGRCDRHIQIKRPLAEQ